MRNIASGAKKCIFCVILFMDDPLYNKRNMNEGIQCRQSTPPYMIDCHSTTLHLRNTRKLGYLVEIQIKEI